MLAKTYTLTANGVTYTYGPTTNDDRNFYTGINNLGVPGLTMGVAPGPLPVPVQLTYVGQAPGDTLILADTNGWTHVGLTAGSYKVGSVRLGTSSLRWNEVNLLSANIDAVPFSYRFIRTVGTQLRLKFSCYRHRKNKI